MANEPNEPNVLREEWVGLLFVGVILLAIIGAGVVLLLGL